MSVILDAMFHFGSQCVLLTIVIASLVTEQGNTIKGFQQEKWTEKRLALEIYIEIFRT